MIPYGRQDINQADIDAVCAVLRSDWLTQGPRIEEFEKAIAGYVGSKYAVAVSSGTAALHLACLAAKIGPNDKVITSTNTFVASANCARYVGAEPQFTDIDAETLNLDPEILAEDCKKAKTLKAIIPVHFGGAPCEMRAISDIAREHGAMIIEDACHALGATYPEGGRVGGCPYSDMTVFSFHPVKIIAAGEGGMITTNSEAYYRRLLRLRSHGINKMDDAFHNIANAFNDGQVNPWYYELQELGYNYRITDIQAALALSQFARLDTFLARRKEIALAYDSAFNSCTNIKPTQLSGRRNSAHHLYVVRIDFRNIGISRREFMIRLRADGILPQVHYIPAYMHPYYQRRGANEAAFPVTRLYYEQALSIPMYYALSRTDQEYVIEKISKIVQ